MENIDIDIVFRNPINGFLLGGSEKVDFFDKSGKYLSEISKTLLTEQYTIRVILTKRIDKFINFRSIINRF